MKIIKGTPSDHKFRLAIILSRFNEEITGGLLNGALSYLKERGYGDEDITIAEVPGAFEIPLTAEAFALQKKFDALICLGAVIKGETAHFEFISKAVQEGILQTSLRHCLPVGFGVITTYTDEQAAARSGDNKGNKGREAAEAAVEMAEILRRLKADA